MYQLDNALSKTLEQVLSGPMLNVGCLHDLSVQDQLSHLRSIMLPKGRTVASSFQLLDMPIVLHYDGGDHYNSVYAKTPAGWACITFARLEELCDLSMGMVDVLKEDAADYLTGHRNSLYTLEALAAIRHH